MIKQVIEFLEEFKKQHEGEKFSRILEIGSRCVDNNPMTSQPRTTLEATEEYIGIDLQEGTNVDKVMSGHDLKKHFKENSFDLTLCFETFEHDDAFWVTAKNMRWVTKPGGWMIVTTPGPHCPFHEWPGDYWRFMKDGVGIILGDFENKNISEMCWDPTVHGIGCCATMGWGRKPDAKKHVSQAKG